MVVVVGVDWLVLMMMMKMMIMVMVMDNFRESLTC